MILLVLDSGWGSACFGGFWLDVGGVVYIGLWCYLCFLQVWLLVFGSGLCALCVLGFY